MNERNDPAFEPMDAPVAVGENSDGTVTYKIVEGDTYLDGEIVRDAKDLKVVGTVQLEADAVH